MIYIKTKYYPTKGFNAITHWPFVFYKKDSKIMRNHEEIHGAQQKELLIILFYILYLIEWILTDYKNISFEKEAYNNQNTFDYLKRRNKYANYRRK